MARQLLETEKKFLKENRAVLARKYGNRYLVIRRDEVYGALKTLEGAVTRGAERFRAGPFLAMSPTEGEVRASVPALAIGAPLTRQP